jgi:hypothetical protein
MPAFRYAVIRDMSGETAEKGCHIYYGDAACRAYCIDISFKKVLWRQTGSQAVILYRKCSGVGYDLQKDRPS